MELELRPWTDADLALLLRDDTPEMNVYLGGPDGEDIIRRRHERFLRGQSDDTTWPFTVWAPGESEPVGSVAYWSSEYRDEPSYEAAWAIGTAFQGHGYASGAVRQMLADAIVRDGRSRVWAFPSVENIASNALARAAGFQFLGHVDSEYPPGVPIHVNEWAFDLRS